MYMLFTLYYFFFNDTASTEIYTLSLHDALPISALLDLLKPLLDDAFRCGLELGIERGRDAQAALVDALPPEALDELAAHLLLEIETRRFLDLHPVDEPHFRFPGALGGRFVDRAGRNHRLQHHGPARDRAIEVDRRGVAGW